MQKTLIAATLAAVIGCGAANAADIYAAGGAKDLYVAPDASWTGFYLGLGGGGGAVNHDLKVSGFAEVNGVGGDGGFGTVEVGYDKQFGRFVAGVYFNFDFTSIGSNVSVLNHGASYDLDNLWSVGGRFGYLVNRSTLAYVLAGYSQGNFSASPKFISDKTYDGFNIGGGLETALGGNWFLKAEYRFTDLGEQTLYSGDSFKVTDEVNIHQGRVVLSYKLGSTYEPLK